MEKIPFYFGYSIIQAEYTTKLSILYSRNQILFLDAPKCGLDASVFHWSWSVVFYNDSATFLMRSDKSSKSFLKFVNSSSVVVIFL